MSLIPVFKATLEDNLSDKERAEVVDKLSALKGVVSAKFNENSNKEVFVAYTSAGPLEEAIKIPGVKSTTPLYTL